MAVKKTDSVQEYSKGWYDKMVIIWRDRMDMLGIHDTGALRSSIEKGKFSMDEDGGAMAFHYLEYGIYVDLGTGNGYYRGNPGDLHFLDPTYRLEHKLGAPRKRKPWFNKSWYISVLVLKEKLADVLGEQFSGLFDNLKGRERG